jgi:transcriptional regulator with XRE-family HTH domain
MEKTATKRSVIGNAAVIVARRKALGLNQDDLAEKAGYRRRVIQKLEAGEPVAMETLDDVATALGMTYKEVLVADENVQDEDEPGLLVFKINLGDMKDPGFAEKVRTLISALQQLLPEQTGICILAAAGGVLTVGVQKTKAHEVATRHPEFVRAFGLKLPKYIEDLDTWKPYEYLADVEVYPGWEMVITDSAKGLAAGWNPLSVQERFDKLEAYFRWLESRQDLRHKALKGSGLTEDAPPEVLHRFAEERQKANGGKSPPGVNDLSQFARARHILNQLAHIRRTFLDVDTATEPR